MGRWENKNLQRSVGHCIDGGGILWILDWVNQNESAQYNKPHAKELCHHLEVWRKLLPRHSFQNRYDGYFLLEQTFFWPKSHFLWGKRVNGWCWWWIWWQYAGGESEKGPKYQQCNIHTTYSSNVCKGNSLVIIIGSKILFLINCEHIWPQSYSSNNKLCKTNEKIITLYSDRYVVSLDRSLQYSTGQSALSCFSLVLDIVYWTNVQRDWAEWNQLIA